MGFVKYQSVEKADVLPAKDQQRIASNLHKLGKTSARDLSDDERRKALTPHS